MARRAPSTISMASSAPDYDQQELGSMYDYLAKVILLGPSGSGKSCLLHRFLKNEWRVLTSQTIGVEFASKIVRVGSENRRQRIKLQLWDTAGTERFRSVSRSYYRGAAGALLIYDISAAHTFGDLSTFLHDARSLGSPGLTVMLVGNKVDIDQQKAEEMEQAPNGKSIPSKTKSSREASQSVSSQSTNAASIASSVATVTPSTRQTHTFAPMGREVASSVATRWANAVQIPVVVEVSAYTGDGVAEAFERLASMILTKIELGELDPGDPNSGIQFGDGGRREPGNERNGRSTVHLTGKGNKSWNSCC